MANDQTTVLDILAAEERYCATGVAQTNGELNRELYLIQSREGNAKKSEALFLSKNANPLLRLRGLVQRGRLLEATSFGDALLKAAANSVERVEVILERARVLALQSEWSDCLQWVQKGISDGAAGVSLLTLYQLQALSFFELGEMAKSVQALSYIESLEGLYPCSNSGFYASLQMIKIRARDQGPEVARKSLAKLLDASFSKGTLNLDKVLGLLRVEIDLRRLEKKSYFRYALASLMLADVTGDRAYEALAWLDCWLSADSNSAAVFEKKTRELSSEFSKVRQFLKEMSSETPVKSTSGASLSISCPRSSENCLELLNSRLEMDALIWQEHELVISTKTLSCSSFREHPQIKKAIQVLLVLPMNRDKFFSKIWDLKKFVPRLHEQHIWTLLHRLRSTGLDVKTEKGKIKIRHAFNIV